MLFDLRSRGRRRGVQVIYVGLAFVMVGGLLLVGVGTGTGGGILNAFTNDGSGGNQGQVVSAQLTAALKAEKKDPSSAANAAALVSAYYTVAGEGANYDSATASYTSGGKAALKQATEWWTKYSNMTSSPNSITAQLAANANLQLGDYAAAASAWEIYTEAEPSVLKGFECLAVSAYAANQTRKGDLAATKAEAMAPSIDRLQIKQLMTEAKSTPTVAQQLC
jgi:hypothetical protein